ncbi:MAG: hypothetical protein KGI91_07065 [Burkholderiales bacterium]|nr:hypothetical protein [Burkholderiales bacterium]MDE2432005.1 hypothetical protein [Burkholderiales bacterium]
MNRFVMAAIFALGLTAVAWVAVGFIGYSWMALTMSLVIAGVYLIGALELKRFREATSNLAAAVSQALTPVEDLGAWLSQVPPVLQQSVRLRIEGERVGLPGPALTPYLVGLLVMLGMLGTFLGMVATFKGAVFALEGSTDLQAIRGALSAPIKGLGLSFGTSVAGVATSAMLGLMAAISRRERLDVVRQLDARIATVFQRFSQVHQRQETFKALQVQAQTMPIIVDRLQSMMDGMDRRAEQLNQHLLTQQQQFHQDASGAYRELAQAVGRVLHDSLQAGARAAGESIQPVVASAMEQVAQHAQLTHQRLLDTTQAQLQGLATQLDGAVRTVNDTWGASLQQQLAAWTQSLLTLSSTLVDEWQRVGAQVLDQQKAVCESLETSAGQITERASAHVSDTLKDVAQLVSQSEAMVRARMDSESAWIEAQGQRMNQLADVWRTELQALRDEEAKRGQASVDRLDELQAAVATHLATLGNALEAPMTRLLQTATEVPQAAAEVIGQLRQEMTRLTERDNLALEERTSMMETLRALMQSIQQAADEQRASVSTLVASASSVMEQAAHRFSEALGGQTDKVDDVAAHVSASAVELASLGEAFGQGVRQFQATNEKLIDSLQRIDGAIQQSLSRSDEQLAYYVAQAREVIDLSIASQQGILEDLRHLHAKQATELDRSAA